LINKYEFSSEIERQFDLFKPKDGELAPARCSPATALLLINTREMVSNSLPLRLLMNCPVLIEQDNQPLTLSKGYHRVNGGVYIAKDSVIPTVEVEQAVRLLTHHLFADYMWVTPSDLSRAVAQVLSPCLKMGNLLPEADFPMDVALADQSQSGKTHRMQFTALIYDEYAYPIVNKQKGVGSLDESVAAAYNSGKLFLLADNVRNTLDSQLLETALRGIGRIPIRLPNYPEILLPTDSQIVQLTSNNAYLTTDLINRSIITSNKKVPDGYVPKLDWGEAFIRWVKINQPLLLGAVFAVVSEWIRRGRPHSQETRHAFQEWVQTMDWIVQSIFKLPPLLDGHAETQKLLTNKNYGWFREVVLALVKENKGHFPVAARASDIEMVCDAASINIPGLKEDAGDAVKLQMIGRVLGRIFKDAGAECVSVEGLQVARVTERNPLTRHEDKRYIITRLYGPDRDIID
jgi:hypothetical protein